MRKCPDCEEQTGDNDVVCAVCGYADPGWQQNLQAMPQWLSMPGRPSQFQYTIPITSFVDSHQLAYELMLFERGWHAHDAAVYQEIAAGQRVRCEHPLLIFNFQPMQYDWDNSVTTNESGDILPATVGLTGLMDAHRAIEIARERWQGKVCIEALLPASDHPISDFLHAAELIPAGVVVRQVQLPRRHTREGRFGALETIVPVCQVDRETAAQLPDQLYPRLDELARAGQIDQQFHSPLRKALMELVDNGCTHGKKGCTVAVFLRNEATAESQSSLRLPLSERTVKQIHLFMFCYTTGRTFAAAQGTESEREAIAATLNKQIAMEMGGGLGLGIGGQLRRVRDRAEGTILISSGDYTRIDMPNGIVREWTAESGIALPGVLTCLLIPLANIAAVATPVAS